jgi:glycosyltransferase involved in cell wall biosynthesis
VLSRFEGRITLIDQPNRGSIAAYNRGFAASTGDVIVLLDADDLLEPDALESVAAVWTESVAKVQWDLKIIDAQGRNLGRKFCNFDASYDAARVRDSFRRTGTYRWPVSVGNAYARWFAEAVFPLSAEHGPDGALNTIAPVYGDVVTIPRPLASYRIHGKNLWSNTGTDLQRLPERIRQRASEVALMQRHARERGVALPDQNALDHEIAFVNYRLMAKALGLSYDGSGGDTRAGLLSQALRVLKNERYPARLSVAHAVWFGALALAPRAPAERLMRLRFQRNLVKA